MSLHKRARLALGLFAIVSVATAAFALADDDAKKNPTEGEAKQAAASSAADQAKEMEAWMALAKPGKEHENLKKMAGDFDTVTEMVMGPGAPPQTSKGKVKSKMIMGGRYLLGDFAGEMMGMPMHGSSLMGYDNAKKKYFSTWIDDMGTGIMLSEGTASEDGKVISMAGTLDDPMSGQKKKYRWVTKIVSEDKHTFEWFDADKDGKNEYRMMLVTYTRTK